MEWIIIEALYGNPCWYYGPFPSQDQAESYCEILAAKRMTPGVVFRATKLTAPTHIPAKIHD